MRFTQEQVAAPRTPYPLRRLVLQVVPNRARKNIGKLSRPLIFSLWRPSTLYAGAGKDVERGYIARGFNKFLQ